MMNQNHTRALALAFLLIAATPAPKLVPHPPIPTVPLHAEFLVEVNAKGQVVRVKSGHASGSKAPFWNAEVYGNALQMWIRRPDGSAVVGLFRVTYDYNPKTRKTHRSAPELVQTGGNWANQPGAATAMIQEAEKQAADEAKHDGKSLPPLQTIVGPSASPTKKP